MIRFEWTALMLGLFSFMRDDGRNKRLMMCQQLEKFNK